MVGVPGRSKGCITCRRRKKGCDLQQPTCGRCRKACITCEGYAKSLTFYHHYVDGKKVLSSTSPPEHRDAQQGCESSSVEIVKSVTFSRAAHESGLEGFFWESYMPNGQFLTLFHDTQRALGGSISVIPSLLPGKGTGLLRMCMGAMALTSAAKKDHSPTWMKQQGIKLYMAALVEVRRALSTRRKPDIELLAASRVFSLYEGLHGGDSGDEQAQYNSWKAHHTGDLALIAAQSPSRFATGPAHRLFVDGRWNNAMCALTTRKRIFLSDPAWMTVPWSQYPKTRKDLLVDILLEIPSLYESVDRMDLQDETTQFKQRHSVVKSISILTDRLNDWKEKYASTTSEIPYSSPGEQSQTSGNIAADIIADAHIMTTYWASCILVYDLLQTVSGGECEFTGDDPDECCRSITLCLPIFLHPSTGMFRHHLLPFPLMVAARYLQMVQPMRLQEEWAHLQFLSEHSAVTSIRQFLSSMQPHVAKILSEDEGQNQPKQKTSK